jgi:hypothetical protein
MRETLLMSIMWCDFVSLPMSDADNATGDAACDWQGITCRNGCITSLNVSAASLSGTFTFGAGRYVGSCAR